ncbi:hypothetical protein Peur_047042 [Populus x canadensis]
MSSLTILFNPSWETSYKEEQSLALLPFAMNLMGIEHIHRSLRIGRHINRETLSNSRVRRAKEGGREVKGPGPLFFH